MADIAQLFTAEQIKHLTQEQKTRLAQLDGQKILHAVEASDKLSAAIHAARIAAW